ncbi:hypothetical protein AXG93_509s1140 [Marchantia polymorpha subsp. ruderalis]|uniref:Uncharacterized protein n=3 Tax=Marchantia polymorpha TaxID=3197 RepID=A0A176WBA0_MARPO|nr:hypothetical protein AXG93_509s1140 [Marchantia polymorpha subsp. ruderalis]
MRLLCEDCWLMGWNTLVVLDVVFKFEEVAGTNRKEEEISQESTGYREKFALKRVSGICGSRRVSFLKRVTRAVRRESGQRPITLCVIGRISNSSEMWLRKVPIERRMMTVFRKLKTDFRSCQCYAIQKASDKGLEVVGVFNFEYIKVRPPSSKLSAMLTKVNIHTKYLGGPGDVG